MSQEQSEGVKKMLQAGKEAREKKEAEAKAHAEAVKVEISNANQGSSEEEITALVKKRLDAEKLASDIDSTKQRLFDLVIKHDTANKTVGSKVKKVGEFDNLSAGEKTVIRTMRKPATPTPEID